MSVEGPPLTYLLPVHSNLSQVEHTAAFVADRTRQTKVLVYKWNTAAAAMKAYYAGIGTHVSVGDFSIDAVVAELRRNAAEKHRVVVLLTASTNYSFGKFQREFFERLRRLFPAVVADVFCVGHCLYGCQSCGIREHNFPVYFTRFVRGDLPYSSDDVRQLLDSKRADQFQAIASAVRPSFSVLIAPSVGPLSFLSDPYIIDALIEAKQFLPEIVWICKLHGFAWLDERHPLSSLSGLERQQVDKLRQHFTVVDEQHSNILPYIEAVDVVISDLDSSVTFEQLYFGGGKIRLAYRPPVGAAPPDDEVFTQHLHLFDSPAGLASLLCSLNALPAKPDGRNFFETKYGKPDGTEVQGIAQARGWNEPTTSATGGALQQPLPTATEVAGAVAQDLEQQRQRQSDDNIITAVAYLSVDLLPVPPDVRQFDAFVAGCQVQLEAMDLPPSLWRRAYEKVRTATFDAGDWFEVGWDGGYQLVARSDLDAYSDVFLVDHAWTTTPDKARQQLRDVPGLLDRMWSMFDLDVAEEEEEEGEGEGEGDGDDEAGQEEEGKEQHEAGAGSDDAAAAVARLSIADAPEATPAVDDDREQRIDRTMERFWRHAQTYQISLPGAPTTSVWYINDELGSAVRCRTGDEPATFRLAPLVVSQQGTLAAYSLLWPLRRVPAGDVATRDSVPATVRDETERKARLRAFSDDDENDGVFRAAYASWLEGFRQPQPPPAPQPHPAVPRRAGPRRPLTVYTDMPIVEQNLRCPELFVVNTVDPRVADVLWYETEFKLFPLLSPGQRVNQFPSEADLVFKHRLPHTVYSAFGGPVDWLPLTLSLTTELPAFIGAFLARRDADKDKNMWIVKPWNSGRSKDIQITNNLSELCRLAEAGPKVASLYLERPLLYEGRKFDLRYIVLLKALHPHVELYVYRMFWIRLANETFSLSDFDQYEKHFTVMNYSKFKLQQLHYRDFIANVEREHSADGLVWADVQTKMNTMFRQTFEAFARTAKEDCSASRGLYGLDVMVTDAGSGFEPRLLEVNFNPDCTRACNYDPAFFNNCFSVLFLDESEQTRPAFEAVNRV